MAGVVAAVAALLLVVVGATSADAQDAPDHSDLQADLTLAQFQWGLTGIDDYTVSYVVTCFCPSPLPTVTVVVEDGAIVSATSSDGQSVLRPRTVPQMFDDIAAAIALPADSISVEFDPGTGRPLSYAIDESFMIADEEYSLNVTGFELGVPTIRADFAAAQQRWNALGDQQLDYTFSHRRICFCPQTGPVTAEVRDGELAWPTQPFDPISPPLTVPGLFGIVDEALNNGTSIVSAEFDPLTGVPEFVSIDQLPGAIDDEITYDVVEFAFVEPCCDPVPEIDVEVSCVAGNGRLDMAVVSTTLVDGPVTHSLTVGRLAPREHVVLSGQQFTEVVTGRPDGPINVVLRVDGVWTAATQVVVACDPVRDEVEVAVSCLGERGRIDVFLTAPPSLIASFIRYDVEIEAVNYISRIRRSAQLSGSEVRKLSVTGRRNGPYDITVSREGVDVATQRVNVSCGLSEDPVTFSQTCLAGNGWLRFDLSNSTDASVGFIVRVGALAPRARIVQPGDVVRVSVTGRKDGDIPVSVVSNAVTVFEQVVTVDCDPDCPDGYALVGDQCLTPNAQCVAPLLELESIGGAAILDPITGEFIAQVDYSCVSSCDPPASPAGPGRCILALP